MNTLSVSALVIGVLVLNVVGNLLTEEYAWRDYEGAIPYDAFKAGVDQHGKSVYVGQVLYENKLIPGKLLADDYRIYYDFGGGHSSQENIKILCSPQSHKLQWMPVNNSKVLTSDRRIFVNGGYEPTHFTYIGRLQTDGVTRNVGKVICRLEVCSGLITTNGANVVVDTEFEILTFKEELWP